MGVFRGRIAPGLAPALPRKRGRTWCSASRNYSGARSSSIDRYDMTLEPCTTALLLGSLGGVIAAALPCCALRFRSRQRYAVLLFGTSQCNVKQTKAFVKTKWFEPAPGGKRGGKGRLHIEFKSMRSTGVAHVVDAKIAVAQEFYDQVHPGQHLPVAYLLDDERVFELAPDPPEGSSNQQPWGVGCCLLCLAALGVVVVAVSGLVTGCFIGYIPFFILVIIGAVLGHLCGWPMARKWKQATTFVTVRQCAFTAGDAQSAPSDHAGCPSTSAASSFGPVCTKEASSSFTAISPCAPASPAERLAS
mmetsp:Transcript_49429/g.142148  ORF Transcript_49429/g.142148 Transcript_49429/m.142148 type:complete len:304 (+) Transcript_49429:55-966(+)